MIPLCNSHVSSREMTYRETDLLQELPGFVAKTPRAKEIVGPLLSRSVDGYLRAARGGAVATLTAVALIASGLLIRGNALFLVLVGGIGLLLGAAVWAFGESNLVDMRRLLRDGTAHEGRVSGLGYTIVAPGLSRGTTINHDGPYLGNGDLYMLWVDVSYEDERGTHTCRVRVASHEVMGHGTSVVVLRHAKARGQVAVLGRLAESGGFRAEMVGS